MRHHSRWLHRIERPGARCRLLCLPYAGASSIIYRCWAPSLGGDVEVCAAELPGRGPRIREPLERRIEPLVSGICDAIAPLSDLPLALFGYSMGALLAFELVRALRRRSGIEPSVLMVAACAAPGQGGVHGARLHCIRDDSEFLAALSRRYGPLAPELLAHDDMRQLVVRLMRADLEALETYQHRQEPALGCRLVAFAGEQDRAAPSEAVRAWRVHASGGFEMRTFPGDHFFLRSSATAVEAEVGRQLARLGPGGSVSQTGGGYGYV